MDFLKSAVASAISKASAFPYSFDERIDLDASVWALYNGTKRVAFPTASYDIEAMADDPSVGRWL
jgi:hypothetical protein